MTRKPVCLGVQWEPLAARGINICVGPDRPTEGGESTATFEHGAYLSRVEFDMSIKDVPAAFELLTGLIYTDPAGNHSPIRRLYMNKASHPGGFGHFERDLEDDQRIVPGGKIWVYAVGWGVDTSQFISTEAHVTLMVDGGATATLA